MVNNTKPVCAEPRCKQPINEIALKAGMPSCDKHKSGMMALIRKYPALKELADHYVGVVVPYLNAGMPTADVGMVKTERDSFSKDLQDAKESQQAERQQEKARLKQQLAQQLAADSGRQHQQRRS